MKKIQYICIIIAAALVQVTLLPAVSIFSITPDLLLLCALMSGFYFNLKWSLVMGIICGVFKDALGVNAFGMNTLLFPLWNIFINQLSQNIPLDNNYVCALLVFILSVFNSIVVRLVFLTLARSIPVGITLRITFLDSLYTGLIAFLSLKLSQGIAIAQKHE